jgi:polyhydroxybutyrate depolymerase
VWLVILLTPSFAYATNTCTPTALSPGWQVITVRSGGVDRKVPLYVPAAGVGHSDIPLVFDLHGSGSNGRSQAEHSGLMALAGRHGFLLANPNGGIADPARPADGFFWNIPGVPLIGDTQMPANPSDDVQFFRDAIQQLVQSACVDPHRVYVTGFSGGARMVSWLACALSERLAAVAPVAGLRAGVPDSGGFTTPDLQSCAPSRAVPIITFHGVHDATNRYDGDGGPRWGYSIPAALARWAKLDGCKTTPAEQSISTHVTKVTYPGCRQGAELVLYRTDAPADHGGGHIWPHPHTASQTAASDREIVDQLDASELIWEFFSRHRAF